MTQIKFANTQDEYLKCWNAISALRPNLTKENYLALIDNMKNQTYQLVFIEDENGDVPAVVGFRYMTMLYCGNIIYIDDLSTISEARGKGYASQLLDFIIDLAQTQKLDGIHLDSGHQRYDAHRLYLNKKLKITAHHFSLNINS
ncbi:acetyltransferase (GNAT) family protein [Arcicella aurantiaca]|uniref:Acetyltransferase (GNAT) family protein n=1 Tax=Arcicella aurantiaca TaxID=591202 RepID=A0A316DXP3_9BACT|nr:GNAT family N-acetyltransferase [Arcicella aurantiaca]PWK22675.1 acetyltransferase (GNAT) family protein [Arcicella aurantiaca]